MMRIFTLFLLLFLVLSTNLPAQEHKIRVCTYNFEALYDYKNEKMERVKEFFERILDDINPNILVATEVEFEFTSNTIKKILNFHNNNETWTYSYCESNDKNDVVIFYNSYEFDLESYDFVEMEPRPIGVFKFTPLLISDAQPLYIVGAHLKSSSATEDKNTRKKQMEILGEYFDDESNEIGIDIDNDKVLFCGDLNIYDSDEEAYELMMNMFVDPINKPGKWNNNEDFKNIHTQSTRNPGWTRVDGGGLDDRFDLILMTNNFRDNVGWTYLDNSYKTYGNDDGKHFNTSIYDPQNSDKWDCKERWLFFASDHLPVLAEFEYINP